jgi:hypothetical protein
MPKISKPVRPLADVNVLPQNNGSHEIVVCFLPNINSIVGEGNSTAFLALDASASLSEMYGEKTVFMSKPNYVEAVARKIGVILTDISRSGNVTGLYWAVSPDGSKIEEIGDFDANGWEYAIILGPQKEKWGRGTKLLPAIKHGIEIVGKDSDFNMGVIITDGIIEDEQDVIDYCMIIGDEMKKGTRKKIKLILIGIGKEVDEAQLERLDDMFEGTPLEDDVDIWSHGMVNSMQDENDILAVLYGELMDEDTDIAPSGNVTTGSGTVIKNWADRLPGKFRFILPKGEKEFVIHASGQEIRQDITSALTK